MKKKMMAIIPSAILCLSLQAQELIPQYVGNYWSISADISSKGIYKFLEEMVAAGKNNPIVLLNTPGSSIMGRKVLIRDPRAIKKIFSDHLKDNTTKERSFMAMRRLLGNLALLTSDADDYHVAKKANFIRYFGPGNMENFLPIMQKQSNKILARWFEKGEIENLYVQVRDATLGVIKDITFGIEDGDNLEMGQLLENAIRISASVPLDVYFQALYFQKLQGWYISYAYPEMAQYSEQVHTIISKLFDQAYNDKIEYDTYLNFLKKERGITDTPDNELIRDLLTAYLGGHDTTTSFLTFMIEYLAFHPELQNKIRQEIQTHLSIKLTNNEQLNRNDLSQSALPALHEFVESFAQIIPPVGASGRDVTQQFTLTMDNYSFTFYPGDQIIFPLENLYDPAINEYASTDPEQQIKLSFQNGSPYTCPGQIFAKTEAKIFLILSLWNHEISPMDPLTVAKQAQRENRGTIVPVTPIQLKLRSLNQ